MSDFVGISDDAEEIEAADTLLDDEDLSEDEGEDIAEDLDESEGMAFSMEM